MAAQNRNQKVKRLALMGLLFALAMALSFLESLLPALPMLPPGIRLGLSNIITMYALFVLGPASGYTIAVLKSLFESSPVWRDFSHFIETDMPGAGLQEITIDNNYKSVIYDLSGRPLSTPLPGQIYIREGRKVLFQSK